MSKNAKFGITLAVAAILIGGGIFVISKQSGEATCPYCSEVFPSQGELSMHKMRCEENDEDQTIVKGKQLKVRNND